MRNFNLILVFILAITFSSCGGGKVKEDNTETEGAETPASVYFGGDIITMEGDSAERVEALVVRDGMIAFVGNKEEALRQAGEGHKLIDLKGQTLLPGFVDGHAHFHGFGAQAVTANLLASPDGNTNDIPGLVKAMKE
jgi:predicted amidohydrolase YtcJ